MTAPPAPISPTIAPPGWTNGPITISWANPSDATGIAKVWYRLDQAPTVGTPGTSIIVSTPSAQIPITTPRSNRIYFYLEDGAGNRNVNNNTNVQYKFDNVAPAITHDPLLVPRVTVLNGSVLGGNVNIAASVSDGLGESGAATLGMQYRRIGDTGYSALIPMASLTNGTAQIPLQTFVVANHASGVNYRLVATDTAGNVNTTGDFSVSVKDSTPPESPKVIPAVVSGPASVEVKAYRMFSVPYDLDDKRPNSFMEKSLGSHINNGVSYYEWRMRMHNPDGTDLDYEDFKASPVVTKGKGFFLIVRNPGAKRMQVGSGELIKAREMFDT